MAIRLFCVVKLWKYGKISGEKVTKGVPYIYITISYHYVLLAWQSNKYKVGCHFSLLLFVCERVPASIINVLRQFQLHQFWKDSRNMSWKVKIIPHLSCYKGGVLGCEGLAGPINFSLRASLWISFWPQGSQGNCILGKGKRGPILTGWGTT